MPRQRRPERMEPIRLDNIFESYLKGLDPFEYITRKIHYPLTRSRRWAWRPKSKS